MFFLILSPRLDFTGLIYLWPKSDYFLTKFISLLEGLMASRPTTDGVRYMNRGLLFWLSSSSLNKPIVLMSILDGLSGVMSQLRCF